MTLFLQRKDDPLCLCAQRWICHNVYVVHLGLRSLNTFIKKQQHHSQKRCHTFFLMLMNKELLFNQIIYISAEVDALLKNVFFCTACDTLILTVFNANKEILYVYQNKQPNLITLPFRSTYLNSKHLLLHKSRHTITIDKC